MVRRFSARLGGLWRNELISAFCFELNEVRKGNMTRNGSLKYATFVFVKCKNKQYLLVKTISVVLGFLYHFVIFINSSFA